MFLRSKINLPQLIGALLVFSCGQEETPSVSLLEQNPTNLDLITSNEIDQLILNSIQETGDFVWMEQSDQLLFSALMLGDSILTIGYKPVDLAQPNSRIGLEDLQGEKWKASAAKIVNMITETVADGGGPAYRLRDKTAVIHEKLPYLEVKISTIEVLHNLRKMEEVRYFEPLGYQFNYELLNGDNPYARLTSDSGCSNDPQSNLAPSDYSVLSPGAKASWNYPQMGITQAWALSTGSGITVGVIDTGLSQDQMLLGSGFNSGESSGRTVQKFGTYKTGFFIWKNYDGPNDQCGHGTAMAGVVASPRNTTGAAVGVAYNSNLVSVRGTSDVIFNSSDEKNGVAEALVLLGNRTDVKIISMSIGDVFSNSKVADAIRYAYNRGKLIFAAAGTSTTFTNWYGVIFPATMSETVAVTGVKEGSGYQRCGTCHSGSKVEFTVVMERAGSNTKPITLASSGDSPSTVGGSSVATSTASGIAALVWAKNPSWTRTQVLNQLRTTADLYPNRNSQYGYGNMDAAAAVGVY
ncbi:S8 family serine peptidase [Algoriphagus aestuariicola]|uniref:S8 family serine peptidase n=1 Tax=Algoriphagus aestuariicola TaxID=1852016 RepID=A0ABS3BN57_9BACT|nr:S8 family serine peptidase [Algoriphagus aestuariicola]MBN7800437.1 S8 family serine peptidase [Algoriphagus aestuariicola]